MKGLKKEVGIKEPGKGRNIGLKEKEVGLNVKEVGEMEGSGVERVKGKKVGWKGGKRWKEMEGNELR